MCAVLLLLDGRGLTKTGEVSFIAASGRDINRRDMHMKTHMPSSPAHTIPKHKKCLKCIAQAIHNRNVGRILKEELSDLPEVGALC